MGCVSTPRPGRFIPGKERVPILQDVGWAPGPFSMGAENLAPNGNRSPDRPHHSDYAIVAHSQINIVFCL